MKKSIALSLAVVTAFTAISTVDAKASLDELSYNPASPALAQKRQANYLDALAKRYELMYNNARHDRYYYNTYLQQARMEELKKENNIAGNLSSEMPRMGELETNKTRVRTTTNRRTEAVNAKQTFRKAAINYYVDGGNGYGSTEAMEMGNVDGMKNIVERRPSTSAEYKFVLGGANLTTRDMVRLSGVKSTTPSVSKRNTYYKGNFYKRMSSPFMSTEWMK